MADGGLVGAKTMQKRQVGATVRVTNAYTGERVLGKITEVYVSVLGSAIAVKWSDGREARYMEQDPCIVNA